MPLSHLTITMGVIIATEREEASLSTEKSVLPPIDSHVSQTDSFPSGCLTSSSHPTTLSMMGRQSPIHGYTSTLSQLSWPEVMMILRFYIFPWHLMLCHSPSSTGYVPTPLTLGNNSSTSFARIFVESLPIQVLRLNSECVSRNQTSRSSNTIAALLSYEPKFMTLPIER